MWAGSSYQARRLLRGRLEERRAEIEQEVSTRIYGISDPANSDPAYLDGLRASISIALDYGLEAIERGEERTSPPPPALLAQARMAARSGVGLDTVLRRYFAGYVLLDDFLADETERGGLPPGAVPTRLRRDCAALFDRLIAAVGEEYGREAKSRFTSIEHRRGERVERLLAGEPLDISEFPYDFDLCHVGMVAEGPGAAAAIQGTATALDGRLLLVRRDGSPAWGWLAARRPINPGDVVRFIAANPQWQVTLALGEPAEGLAGWRLTHRQAAAALPIAVRGNQRFVRYADVGLIASILRDDLLATSLQLLYLTPLEEERDGGAVARETLRAYFRSNRNASSTAAALGVNRNTVAARLQAIEERIGRPLHDCTADLEAALSIEALQPDTQSQLTGSSPATAGNLRHIAQADRGRDPRA